MDFDLLLLIAVAALFSAASVLVLWSSMAARTARLLAIGVVGIAAAVCLRTSLGLSAAQTRLEHADYPVQRPDDGYVTSNQCKACHPREYATWHASYHRTMTQRPSRESVAGVFNVSLDAGGRRYDLAQRGSRYFVDMPVESWWHDSARGGRIERPVELLTGSHNYQVYWVSSGNSHMLAQLPYVYLIAEKLWMPRQSVFMLPPDEVLGSEFARWNTTCIQCHSTDGRPKPALPHLDAAYSEVSEYGIACEACHGPASKHVANMSNPLRRYSARLGWSAASGIVNPKRLPSERSAQVCGQCHGVTVLRRAEFNHWLRAGLSYRPGDDLSESNDIVSGAEARDDTEHFWPDGTPRVTGRELNALTESPCFRGGKFSCITCHEPHKQESDSRSIEQWRVGLLQPSEEGNAQCLQCHGKLASELVAHTHHAPASSGSACVNCHMPHTVYGLAKTERDHRISNPSLQTELATGRPNACNLCHVDRTLAWTDQYLSQWYRQPTQQLSADQQRIAASLLWLYRGDAHQRAIAMWAMGWSEARAVAGQDWIVPELTRAMGDPYQVLGLVAWRSLRNILGEDRLPGSILEQPPAKRVQATEAAIGSRPGLDDATVARLLSQRDNRPVRLSE
jgi:hypothetical protein